MNYLLVAKKLSTKVGISHATIKNVLGEGAG